MDSFILYAARISVDFLDLFLSHHLFEYTTYRSHKREHSHSSNCNVVRLKACIIESREFARNIPPFSPSLFQEKNK